MNNLTVINNCCKHISVTLTIEGLRERTEYIDIFLFSARHSIVFCFRCSVYWWKGSVRFQCFKILLVKFGQYTKRMSMYSNRLQPVLKNLLQRVVWFFHPRSSCPTHISADICGGRKSLVKPVTRQNISSCSVLSPEIVMHDDAYIGGRSENNIKCIVHDDLG